METSPPMNDSSKQRPAKWLLTALALCAVLATAHFFRSTASHASPDDTGRPDKSTRSTDRSPPGPAAADNGSAAGSVVPPAGNPGIPEIHGTPGAEVLPGWLPLYPGASRAEIEDHSLRSDGLSEGKIAFLVRSDPEEVLGWFGRQAGTHGMSLSEDEGRYISANGQRAFRVSSEPGSGDHHRITVDFRDQGEGCACPSCGEGGH